MRSGLKYIVPLLLCTMLSSCGSSKVSESGFAEKALVTRFLNLWVKSFHDERMNAFIAPNYLKTNKVSLEKQRINNFAPVDFTIEYYNKGIVTARIWGEDHKWEHRILFNVIKYRNKHYLLPSKHDEKFVTPWYSVALFVNR